MKFSTISALAGVFFTSLVTAQLSGTVGPTTSTASKAATKVCNILDYGGVASTTTDNGPPIASAWAACASGGEGEYPLDQFKLWHLLTQNGSVYTCGRLWNVNLGFVDGWHWCCDPLGWNHLPYGVSDVFVLMGDETDKE